MEFALSKLEVIGEAIAYLAALSQEPDLTSRDLADLHRAIALLERILDRI
jgi:hypothetical protein